MKTHSIYASQLSEAEKESIKGSITKLGGIFDVNLKFTTTVILMKDVLSVKYNMGKILKTPFLKYTWVTDSLQKGELLPIEDYKLGIFEGITVGILGFSP